MSNAGPGRGQERPCLRPRCRPASPGRSVRRSPAARSAAGTLTCDFATLANAATRTITLTRATTAADCGPIPNTVTVAATNENTDTDQFSNTDSDTIVVQCPDLSVVKTGNGPLNAGQPATFTITVSNAGPGAATNATLNDQLPAGTWSLGGADAAACQISGSNLLTCAFDTIAAGGQKVVTVTTTTVPTDCPSIHNVVTVAASNEAPAATGNNTDDADIVVNCPDIQVVKDGNGPISAGDPATFTITVTNLGPGVASGVTLDDSSRPVRGHWAAPMRPRARSMAATS